MSQPLDTILTRQIARELTICDYMDDYAGYFPAIADFLEDYLDAADVVMCTSPEIASLIPLRVRGRVQLVRSAAHNLTVSLRNQHAREGVVFAGALNERVHVPLLCKLAKALNTVRLTLVGPIQASVEALSSIENVRTVPPSGPQELFSILSSHRVGVIPYRIDGIGHFCDPLKYFDYLSAGLRIVSTSIPSMLLERPHAQTASSDDEFIQLVRRNLELGSLTPDEVLARNTFLARNTWADRADAVSASFQCGGTRPFSGLA